MCTKIELMIEQKSHLTSHVHLENGKNHRLASLMFQYVFFFCFPNMTNIYLCVTVSDLTSKDFP